MCPLHLCCWRWEAFSHITAVLFANEPNTEIVQVISCTSNPCSYSPPSSKIVAYISEIEFTTTKLAR